MKPKRSNIREIVKTYKSMTQKQIDTEIDELSNMIYALLVVTESKDIEVQFDREVVIKMELKQITEMLN
jgi:hypothetical protein